MTSEDARGRWIGTLAVLSLLGCGGSSSSDGGGGTGGNDGAAGDQKGDGGGGGGGTGGGGGGGGGAGGGGGGAGGGGGGAGGAGGGSGGAGGGMGSGLAGKYPGDKGIDKDPAVVWYENFEEGTVGAVTGRYDQSQNAGGMTLVADVPAASAGKASLRLRSGGGTAATDLYKMLPKGEEELYVRWYVKYQAGGVWHHSGFWFGGYNPAMKWPSPMAGIRPGGDDRFSVSIEPLENKVPSPRLDFYNYWMRMRSWKDMPSGTDAYYGNAVVQQKAFKVDDDAWMCLEVHVKMNASPSSGAGAELGAWKNDASIQQFTDAAPTGYWIKDYFCPTGADSDSCIKYKPAMPKIEPLDLQWRSTASLQINALWPQNYVTDGPAADMWLDDIVAARVRVGCVK